MIDTVLLISRDRAIAKKVRDACGILQAEFVQVGRLDDAVGGSRHEPVGAGRFDSRHRSGAR